MILKIEVNFQVIKFLQRFLSNPKEFIQRVSLKYAYKNIPNHLNFRTLRGFYTAKYYKEFYQKFDGYCFVVPLGIPYNYMKQRPQHIATQMSEYFPTFYYTGALFVNDDKVKGVEKIQDNFFLINDGINGNSIFNVSKKIIYTFWVIDHYFYVKNDKDSFVIYDYLDEIDITPRFNEDTIKKHYAMMNRANLILTSSDNLYKKIPKEHLLKTLLITNGVQYSHFYHKLSPRPISNSKLTIGFYGALEKWIDIDLIEKLASIEDFELKIIGPIVDPIFERLKKYKNIKLLGHQPYAELPLLTKDVDVFILPFLLSELTKSVSPVKLYEYFATGKPVVSTALPECEKYDTVYIMDIENCEEKIREAYEKFANKEYIELSQSYAKDNSWDRKVKIIFEKIVEMESI